MAYEDKAGTKEKFDKQFGAGAAERILAEVKRVPEPVQVSVDLTAIKASVQDMRAEIERFRADVSSIAKVAAGKQDPNSHVIAAVEEKIMARLDAKEAAEEAADIEEEIADAEEDAAEEKFKADTVARIDKLTATLEAMSRAMAGIDAKIASAVRTAEKPAQTRPMNIRVTQRDINDNIIAVEVV